MRHHFVNDDKKLDGTKGSIWKAGRLYFYRKENSLFNIQWRLFSGKFGIGMEINDEDWVFHFKFVLFSLYFCIPTYRLDKISPKREVSWNDGKKAELIDERECGLDIFYWRIWVKPWCKLNRWNSADPWWKRGFNVPINPLDILFGERRYHYKNISDWKDIEVPMIEGSYQAKYKVLERSYGRKRLPFFREKGLTTDIEIPEGIPFPGKGENSWDCGMDRLYGCATDINYFSDAEAESKSIACIVENVIKSRKKYGSSSSWVPPKEEE